jgi:hypothetical protein
MQGILATVLPCVGTESTMKLCVEQPLTAFTQTRTNGPGHTMPRPKATLRALRLQQPLLGLAWQALNHTEADPPCHHIPHICHAAHTQVA